MSVVIDFEDAGPWRKRLTIEVPAPAVDAEAGRVAKQLGRSVQLPGFRKGKIPPTIIAKRFPEEIERQVTEKLLPRYWHQAEAEKQLDTLGQPQVEEVNFALGEPMTFVAVVETRPDIELRNIEDFTLPEGESEPTEEEIEQALGDLRRQHAAWEPVEREAANGDLVVTKAFQVGGDEEGGDEEGGDEEEPQGRPLHVEIGGEGVDEELSLALTGLSAGSQTTHRLPTGEEGETREFRLEVEEVREQDLPELDDDLAAKIGEFEDVEALRKRLVENLRENKTMQLRHLREQAVLEQLRERHPLELPEGVVQREVEGMIREQASRLAAQGIDVEKAPINWDGLAEQMEPEARRRAHNQLLLDAVAKARDIRVDEQEFERVLAGIARQRRKTSLAIRQELDETGRLDALRAQLREGRALRVLLGEETAEAHEAEPPNPKTPDQES